MWSTFVVQDEETTPTAISGRGTEALARMISVQSGGCKRRTKASSSSLSDRQEGKIKLVFLVATVGITLTVLGVGTEFWVELASSKSFYNNETCLAAHYGLWKSCMKRLWVADVDPERETCGPIDLLGGVNMLSGNGLMSYLWWVPAGMWAPYIHFQSNCTYFKIYTTGENTVLFRKMPAKNLTVTSAMLAIFSLFLMVMGAVCIIMAISKGVQFFLKPASVCFALSGFLVFLSLIVFHQSVLSFLASDHSIPLHHELSWSVICMGCAGTIVILAGVLFFILTLPYSLWEKCLPNRNPNSS